MAIRESASNAGRYNCPKCIHDFPDKDPAEDSMAICMKCMAGSNFKARPLSPGELLYDFCSTNANTPME